MYSVSLEANVLYVICTDKQEYTISHKHLQEELKSFLGTSKLHIALPCTYTVFIYKCGTEIFTASTAKSSTELTSGGIVLSEFHLPDKKGPLVTKIICENWLLMRDGPSLISSTDNRLFLTCGLKNAEQRRKLRFKASKHSGIVWVVSQ